MLVVGQAAAVAFILGPVECLVFDGAGIRAAWSCDKTTALEGYVRSAFETVLGAGLDYTTGLVFDYLGVFAPWPVPAAAIARAALAWALIRSVKAGQGCDVFPPFPAPTLALVAPLTIPLWWLPGDGPADRIFHAYPVDSHGRSGVRKRPTAEETCKQGQSTPEGSAASVRLNPPTRASAVGPP